MIEIYNQLNNQIQSYSHGMRQKIANIYYHCL